MARGNAGRLRVLLVAEAANPEWASVPLVGWSHCRALGDLVDAHVVTQVRNQDALLRAGWRAGREFTAIDSERVARPLWRAKTILQRLTGLGWTLSTAVDALSYSHFERLAWRELGPRIRAGEFDVVHRVTPLTPTAPSPLAAKCARARVPFVLGPLNGGVAWPRQFSDVRRKEGEWLAYARGAHRLVPGYRATRRLASAILIGSIATWNEFAPWRSRCVYVPENGVDPERFRAVASGTVRLPLRATFVGRLVPYKGADMLVEAAAPLAKDGRLEVDIIGDGPEMGRLRRMVADRGLDGKIRLAGWVEHARVQERLAPAHVFVFPSVREFGGGAVLEAMAVGLVPIVVDYAGPSELVTDSTGYRIPIGRRAEVVARLGETLRALCDRPQGIRAMGERARARVLSKFTWAAKARQTCRVYEWALGRAEKPDFGMPFGD